MAKILIADDEADLREGLRRICQRAGHEVIMASNGREAVELARAHSPDLLVLDNRMPELSGLDALAKIREKDRDVVALLYSAYDDPADVQRAIGTLGAAGYLLKSAGPDAVRAEIQKALLNKDLAAQRRAQGEKAGVSLDFAGMLGRSPHMQDIFNLIRRISHSDVTVLVQGESGTGKELVARALHEQGLRAPGPYVTVDCGSLPDTLVESELFGYEAGAFTDARHPKPGKIELANGGTLFLDEIGNLPLSAQAKLLRVIEERRLTRLGSTSVRDVDVRIIAATNLDLEESARAKVFREDLYYRLDVFKIWLPPLRERREDIPALVEYFAQHHAARQGRKAAPRIDPAAMAELVTRPWPGNVRELRNVMERAVLLSGDVIGLTEVAPVSAVAGRGRTAAALGAGSAGATAVAAATPAVPAAGDGLVLPPVDLAVPLKDAKRVAGDLVERAYILAALRSTRWNKSKAATILGLNYKTLREKVRELGLDPLRWKDPGAGD